MLQFSSEPGYDEEITLIIGKALKCLALVRTGRRFIKLNKIIFFIFV